MAFDLQDCDKYSGTTVSFMIGNDPGNNFFLNKWTMHKTNFENCTGLQIIITEFGFGDLSKNTESDLTKAQQFDGYMTKLTWFASLADHFQDLGSYLQTKPRADYAKWYDILFTVRDKLTSYDGKVLSIPFDADFIQTMVREDLLFAHGKDMPQTWEEVADIAEYFQGKDLNDDGEDDFGLCWPTASWGMDYTFFNVVAPKVQKNRDGIFFDPETMEPLWESTAYKAALPLFKRLMMASPWAQYQSLNWFGNRDLMVNGRCAIFMDLPGLLKSIDMTGVRRLNASGDGGIVWRPEKPDNSYWAPLRTKTPGSAQVMDTDGFMKACTKELCPHGEVLISGVRVNRATYWATGGWATAISKYGGGGTSTAENVKEARKDAMWHFFAWANRPEQSAADVAGGGYMDAWRTTHTDGTIGQAAFANAGWNPTQVEALKAQLEEAAGDDTNGAMDIRISGGGSYRGTFTSAVVRLFARKMNGSKIIDAPADELNNSAFAAYMAKEWNQITEDNGGKLALLRMYRKSLNMGALSNQALCTSFFDEANAEAKGTCIPECTSGNAYNSTAKKCEACEEGKYAQADGQMQCFPCQAGSFMDAIGAEQCNSCAPGRFSLDGATKCEDCTPGKAQEEARSSECSNCTLGYHADKYGAEQCTFCERGKYTVIKGAVQCDSCSDVRPGLTTINIASQGPEFCVCPKGEYEPASGFACKPCGEGLDCEIGSKEANIPSPGSTVSTGALYPKLQPKYYSEVSKPLDVYECISKSSCPGGLPNTCGDHRDGLVCGSCKEGYYETLADGCQKCPDHLTAKAWIPIVLAVVGAPLIWLLAALRRDDVPHWQKPGVGLMGAAFVMLAYIQILGMSSNMKLTLSGKGLTFMGSMAYALDVLSVLKPECSDFHSVIADVFFQLLLPVFFVVVCLLSFLISILVGAVLGKQHRLYAPAANIANTYGSGFSTLFLTIATQALSMFMCYDHPNGKSSVRSYPGVICQEGEWNGLVAAGTIAILVYGVGALSITCFLLFRAPAKYHDANFRMGTKFIFVKFRIGMSWWLLVLLAKSLWMSLSTVFFSEPVGQLTWLFCGLCIYIVACTIALPWRFLFVSVADCVAHVMLAVVYFMMAFVADVEMAKKEELEMAIITVASLGCLGLVAFAFMQVARPRIYQMTEIREELADRVHTVFGNAARQPDNLKILFPKLPDVEVYALKTALELLLREQGAKGRIFAGTIEPTLEKEPEFRPAATVLV